MLPGLDQQAQAGRKLLELDSVIDAHDAFGKWVEKVAAWLGAVAPDSGLAAEWSGLGQSQLYAHQKYFSNVENWTAHRLHIQSRLRWLGHLPSKVQLMQMSGGLKKGASVSGPVDNDLSSKAPAYVNLGRIADLKQLDPDNYDLSRLIRLCEELNNCWSSRSYHATSMLARTVINHVSPILGYKTFAEVANNYGGGQTSKSFKESMQRLDHGLRKVADGHLHIQIRRTETLPNDTQVNFSNELDVLLAEIVRVLTDQQKGPAGPTLKVSA